MEAQRRKDTKLTVIDSETERLAREIVDSVFKIHNYFGPGLLESIYESALCRELEKKKIKFIRQQSVPVFYEGDLLGEGFRADIIVEEKILVELKSCEKLLPVHKAQTLSYIRLSEKPLGFLINFNNTIIKNGIVRLINERLGSSSLSANNAI